MYTGNACRLVDWHIHVGERHMEARAEVRRNGHDEWTRRCLGQVGSTFNRVKEKETRKEGTRESADKIQDGRRITAYTRAGPCPWLNRAADTCHLGTTHQKLTVRLTLSSTCVPMATAAVGMTRNAPAASATRLAATLMLLSVGGGKSEHGGARQAEMQSTRPGRRGGRGLEAPAQGERRAQYGCGCATPYIPD